MKKTATAIVGSLIFAGLPLLIWGPSQWRVFASQPARATYVLAAVAVQVLAAILVPGGGRVQREGNVTLERQRVAVFLLQILTVGVVTVSPWSDRYRLLSLSEHVRIGGVIFFIFGALLMNWSVAWLGRHFSVQVTIQKDHRLVTDGPYSIVRHPRYLGILFYFLGISLVFSSGPGLVLVGMLLMTLLWRVYDEEVFMARAFHEEWNSYTRQTARFIPFLY